LLKRIDNISSQLTIGCRQINSHTLVPVEELNYVDLKRPLKENESPKKNSIKIEPQIKIIQKILKPISENQGQEEFLETWRSDTEGNRTNNHAFNVLRTKSIHEKFNNLFTTSEIFYNNATHTNDVFILKEMKKIATNPKRVS
jgi:hypothetical protein